MRHRDRQLDGPDLENRSAIPQLDLVPENQTAQCRAARLIRIRSCLQPPERQRDNPDLKRIVVGLAEIPRPLDPGHRTTGLISTVHLPWR